MNPSRDLCNRAIEDGNPGQAAQVMGQLLQLDAETLRKS
jgi:hypothetical protein